METTPRRYVTTRRYVDVVCLGAQCHPDRLKAKGGDEGGNAHTELYRELMAEETFKLVTYHRDILKAQMGGA